MFLIVVVIGRHFTKCSLGPANIFCTTQDADLMNSVVRIR